MIPGQFPVTQQNPRSHVPTLQDPLFIHTKQYGLFLYATDFAQSRLPRTEIFEELHSAAIGSSGPAQQQKRLFPATIVFPRKPQVPPSAADPVPTIFTRPITTVEAPAQPTSGPTSSHTTPPAQRPQNVRFSQPSTQQAPATGSCRPRSVRMAAPAPEPSDDSSSSDDDAGNNNSNRLASSTRPESVRRSQSVASTGTRGLRDSKLTIPKFENNSQFGKWRQSTAFVMDYKVFVLLLFSYRCD